MRISDWSSDVCSSDLLAHRPRRDSVAIGEPGREVGSERFVGPAADPGFLVGADVERAPSVRRRPGELVAVVEREPEIARRVAFAAMRHRFGEIGARSEEHTSELQSLMRIPYAVF